MTALGRILDDGRTPEEWVDLLSARGIRVSARLIREKANAIGACHRLGREMIITPEDMDRILEEGKCRSKPTPGVQPGGSVAASNTTGGQSPSTIGAALAHLQRQARGTGAAQKRNGKSVVISLATKPH